MINYAEVTPRGYRTLGFQEVIGLSRDNRWISRDLIDAHHKASTSAARRREADMENLVLEYYESRARNAAAEYNGHYAAIVATNEDDPIVQMVTDATSANQRSWVNVEGEMDTMMANPCTLNGASHHVVHALKGDQSATPPLEPITMYVKLVADSKLVESVVTNREVPKQLLKQHSLRRLGRSNGARKHSATRMGQVHRVLERLKELERPLKDLTNDDAFLSWRCNTVKTAADKKKTDGFTALIEKNLVIM